MGEWVSILHPRQYYSRLTLSTSSVFLSAYRCFVLVMVGEGGDTQEGRGSEITSTLDFCLCLVSLPFSSPYSGFNRGPSA